MHLFCMSICISGYASIYLDIYLFCRSACSLVYLSGNISGNAPGNLVACSAANCAPVRLQVLVIWQFICSAAYLAARLRIHLHLLASASVCHSVLPVCSAGCASVACASGCISAVV